MAKILIFEELKRLALRKFSFLLSFLLSFIILITISANSTTIRYRVLGTKQEGTFIKKRPVGFQLVQNIFRKVFTGREQMSEKRMKRIAKKEK